MRVKKSLFLIIFLLIGVGVLFPQNKMTLPQNWESISLEQKVDSLLKYLWKYRSLNVSLAFKYGKKALKLVNQSKDFGLRAKTYNLVGVLYRNISKFDSSLYYYKKALEFAKAENDSEQIGYAYNNIGGYYGYNQMYFLALDNVLHARNIFSKIKNKRGIAFCDVQLALWFDLIKDFKDSEYYGNEAIKIRKEINDIFGVAIAQSILSRAYQGGNKHVAALALAESALKIFKKFKSKTNIGFVLGNIANIKLFNKKYKEALRLRFKAIKILESTRDKIALIQNYNGLAEVYFKLKQYRKAITAAHKAISLSEKIGNRISLVNSFKLLMQVYGESKNSKKAIEYSLKYASELDTVLQRQTETRINEFHKIMANSKLIERNIKLQESLMSNKRFLYLSGFTILLTLILIVIIVIQNKKLREHSEKLENTVATKNKLFGIIAHDLKNPFNTLLGYTEMVLEDWEDFSEEEIREIVVHIREVSQKLYDMVENLLQWAVSQTGRLNVAPEYFNLEDVINKTASYMREQANSKNIQIKVETNGKNICYADAKTVETILRNLISNAIKFTKANGEIKISAANKGEYVELKIADNGIGLTEEELNKLFSPKKKLGRGTEGEVGTGLGLLLVKELVELNGGEIKNVKSKKGKGTEFTILLPARELTVS